jgi:DNA (cytosine-5)-methyltransferase 1
LERKDIDELGKIDIITGGFPCQDLSPSGKKKGITGERSGLYFDLMRVVRMARPKVVILENSPYLLSNNKGYSMRAILREISQSGYDAIWRIISARDFGAHHLRKRIWIVCYPSCLGPQIQSQMQTEQMSDQGCEASTNPDSLRCQGRGSLRDGTTEATRSPESDCQELARRVRRAASVSLTEPCEIRERSREWWAVEPTLARMVYGVPNRVDRVKGLGNSIIPFIAQKFGYELLKEVGNYALRK